MTESRIDQLVGTVRAAGLIDDYRARLRAQDHLADPLALALARAAYADLCVYVIAAAGQVWRAIRPKETGARPRSIRISEITVDAQDGHIARYLVHPSGVYGGIPLDVLAERYELVHWPSAR